MQKIVFIILALVLLGAGGAFLYAQNGGVLPFITNNDDGGMVACTMEAKLCPDGVTYVGRQGPNCEFAACPAVSTTTNSGATSSPTTVDAKINKKVAAGSLSLTVQEVVEDSRCPTDVQCIQAGTVRVKVLLASGLGEGSITMTLNTPITTEAEEITLMSVAPTKLSTHQITPTEYTFTFKIVKRS